MTLAAIEKARLEPGNDEGTAGDALRAATLVTCNVHGTIDVMLNPRRLVATLPR